MNNDIAVEILRELWRYKTTDKYTEIEIRRALETAIEAVNGLRPHGEMRLIDADALIETLRESKYMIYHANATLTIIQNNEIERCISFVETASTIKTFTLADIEEQYRKGMEKGLEEARPHGKWIRQSESRTIFFCSNCGREINTTPFTRTDNFPFCHCGADMREGETK